MSGWNTDVAHTIDSDHENILVTSTVNPKLCVHGEELTFGHLTNAQISGFECEEWIVHDQLNAICGRILELKHSSLENTAKLLEGQLPTDPW